MSTGSVSPGGIGKNWQVGRAPARPVAAVQKDLANIPTQAQRSGSKGINIAAARKSASTVDGLLKKGEEILQRLGPASTALPPRPIVSRRPLLPKTGAPTSLSSIPPSRATDTAPAPHVRSRSAPPVPSRENRPSLSAREPPPRPLRAKTAPEVPARTSQRVVTGDPSRDEILNKKQDARAFLKPREVIVSKPKLELVRVDMTQFFNRNLPPPR